MEETLPSVKELFNDDVPDSSVIANRYGDDRDLDDDKAIISEIATLVPGMDEQSISTLFSDDLETVENAITQLHGQSVAVSFILANAVYRLVNNRVFHGRFSYKEYVKIAPERLNMKKWDYSYYYTMGEAWALYHKELVSSGFRPHGDTMKLRYLSKAVERHGKEAVRKLPSTTMREYIDWARGKRALPTAVIVTHPNIKIRTEPKGIFIENRLVIAYNEVQDIVNRGETPYLIGIERRAEINVINTALIEYRKKR